MPNIPNELPNECPNAFSYERAKDIASASAMLREQPEAKLLAGGQSLLASMKLGLSAPSALIDLQGIASMQAIRMENNELVVGAMASHAAIASLPLVRQFSPMLAKLAHGIADQQIRNRGTIGGAISNNDPAACWPAGLLAMGATVQTDRRGITADDFFTGLFTTALEADEIVCAVRFSKPECAAYIKFEQPASRFAIVGVALAKFGTTTRVAVTGLGMGVSRYALAESRLSTRFHLNAMNEVTLEADDVMGDIHASSEYRVHLATVLTRRAYREAMRRGDT
jgi:aerobic carbon-monoxide dehydrogenase medium subunit